MYKNDHVNGVSSRIVEFTKMFRFIIFCLLITQIIAGPGTYAACVAACVASGGTGLFFVMGPWGYGAALAFCKNLCIPIVVTPTP